MALLMKPEEEVHKSVVEVAKFISTRHTYKEWYDLSDEEKIPFLEDALEILRIAVDNYDEESDEPN